MNKRYQAVLDVFALLTTYPKEASALRIATQKTAIAYITKKATKAELVLLLSLANDLGYIDDELYKVHTVFLR